MTGRAPKLRAQLVEQLTAEGYLRTPAWQQAFAEVPRHEFLTRFFRQTPDYAGWEPLTDAHPDWLALVYSDATWVTQLDNDDSRWDQAVRDGPVSGVPSSSSTAPGLMALMLEALDVSDGDRVLEIGTATGYNAALLCHRLDERQVTSIEYDPGLAGRAREALNAAGYGPELLTGDGGLGHAPGAPYDRVIATCAFPSAPPSWLAQTQSGGVILTNLARPLGGGALIRLAVAADGSASGRFLTNYGSFMATRTELGADAQNLLGRALHSPGGTQRSVSVGAEVLDLPDFGMLAALLLLDVVPIGFDPGSGKQQWLLSTDGSWACLHLADGTVEQYGPTLLWDEVEMLHEQWQQAGAPTRDKFGLTVTANGEHKLWLDKPSSPFPQQSTA